MVTGLDSVLVVEDAYILNNTAAVFGGAFRVISDGQLFVRRAPGSSKCLPVTSGSGTLSRPPCSVIEGNSADSGGALSLTGAAVADLDRTIARSNTASGGGAAQFALLSNLTIDPGPASYMNMTNSLVTGHDGTLFIVGNNATAELRWSTLAGSGGGTMAVLGSASGNTSELISVANVIEHGAGLLSLGGDGTSTASANCTISNQPITDFTSVGTTSQIDPALRSIPLGDFRPSDQSPAIDICVDGFSTPDDFDLDGNPRGLDWTGPEPPRPPSYYPEGLYDVGAYEVSWPGDGVFSDRFE